MFNLFQLCQKDEISFDNNVEATFDFVEKIVRLVAFVCTHGRTNIRDRLY